MKTYWLVFVIYSSVLVCQAQNNIDGSRRELNKIIPQIANLFDVKFSYADEALNDKWITLPDFNTFAFEELIVELERQSKLKFEQVSEEYIIVRPYAEGDLVTVCGYVHDNEQTPLIGVTVSLANTSSGKITDKQGFFLLEKVPFETQLDLRFVGFESKEVSVRDLLTPDCSHIRMDESTAVLEEIIVRDYLTVGVTKVKKDIKIFPQQLKILPGLIEPDILQSLQQSPGVNSPYETVSGLHVRGGSPDQNLVLWNGIKTYNQGHFFGMLSAFNPYITKNVTFVKNGTSAQYGDRVSSVIDIRTDESVTEKLSGGAGSNMIYADAYLSAPIIKDKLSFQVSGRRSFTDLAQTITYDQLADRVFQNTKINEDVSSTRQGKNEFYFNDFTTNFIWQLNTDNSILINTLYNKNELDFSSSDALDIQTFNDKLYNANEGYNIRWRNMSSGRFTFDMDAYYAKYLLEYQFITSSADTTDISSKKNSIADIGGNLNTRFKLSDNQSILTGYQFSNNNIRYAYESFTPSYSLILDADNSTINTHSVYSEYHLEQPQRTIKAGLRLNHYSELDKTIIEPRIFAEHQLFNYLRVNASGEYKSQTASRIKESVVSDLSLENQVWTLSSKERFPVIKSFQVTLGSNYNRNGWYIDTEVFHKKISGVTTLTFGFLNPTDNEFRRGDSEIIGTDLFVKRQFEYYRTWLAYSYLRTENKFFGLNDNEPFPGNWNIEHTITWSHLYAIKSWQFSLGWMWHTGKSFTDVTEVPATTGPIVIAFSSINGRNLPVYHRLDFSAIYDFKIGQNKEVRYRAGLSVFNVYDRRNLLNREFRTTPSLDNELIDTRIYSLGITPNFVFRVFW